VSGWHKKEIRYWPATATGNRMSGKNKKQSGVWMDTYHATIIGQADANAGVFSVLGHARNEGPAGNSNENAAHNQEKTLQNQFFKKITSFMQNAAEVHVTGTGTSQEQFIHYLAETPGSRTPSPGSAPPTK
jgi:hypothetical protein